MSEDLARDHESLLQFVYQFPVAVLRIGGTGEIDLLTPRAVALLHGLGLPIDPAAGWSLLAALDAPLAAQARAAMSSPGAVVMQRPVDFRDPRGRMHHLSLSVLITGVDACMVAIEDVTKRVEQERQLTIQRRNLAVVLESIEGYFVASVDLDLRVIQANRSIERMLGLGAEVVGRPWADLFAHRAAGAPDLRALADEALRQGWSTFEAEYVGADGATLWCDTNLTMVVDESGEASQFVAVVRDVSARQRREIALVEQALSDPLTGLLNRRGLATHLRSWRDAADPARPSTLTAIALDIDFFRLVNDAHGHEGGDEVLRALSRTISQQFRRDDLMVRLGGEEFLVILRDLPDDRAAALAERLRERVAGTPVRWRDASITVTVSLGVATRDFHGDVEALLRDADLALYRAKSEGRNRVARG